MKRPVVKRPSGEKSSKGSRGRTKVQHRKKPTNKNKTKTKKRKNFRDNKRIIPG